MSSNTWELHDVVISKKVGLEQAKQIASKFIPSSRKYYRETDGSYRFRNISKQKFKEFRAKVVNEHITLIFGKIK